MAGTAQASTPLTPSRGSRRFQQAQDKQSKVNGSDDHKEKKDEQKDRSPRTSRAPIATRTRRALSSSIASENSHDIVGTYAQKPKDSTTDAKSGMEARGDEEDDIAKIMALLPAKKKAKLAAAKAQISKQKSNDTVEDGAGSPASSSDDKTNNDNCETCGGVGEFLCCEGCPKAFHFVCLEPPMDAKDVANIKGKWFCNECKAKRHPPRINNRNIFGTLLYKLETSNPALFELPKDIKHFFQGVSANEYGEYVDSGSVKSVRKGKNGQIEEPDYYRLRDKHGQIILCYRCRKSALREKPIIACDYCNLYWHLDCLDPPLTSPPNASRKWMCPNHAEIAMPFRKRQRRHPVIIEPDNPLGTKNNGDIQIVDQESDSKWVSEQMLKYAGVIYRLPETAVKLHFVDHIRSLRESSDQWYSDRTSRRSNGVQPQDTDSPSSSTNDESSFASPTADRRINNLKVASSLHPSVQESREWLEGLVALQSDIANYLKNDLKDNDDSSLDHEGLRMLIRAALGSENGNGDTNGKVEIDRQTLEKYKAIEDLIRVKGEDALLEFLTRKDKP